jgi:hypothetical protein
VEIARVPRGVEFKEIERKHARSMGAVHEHRHVAGLDRADDAVDRPHDPRRRRDVIGDEEARSMRDSRRGCTR